MINRRKSIKLKTWKAFFPFLFAITIVVFHSGFGRQNLNLTVEIEDNTGRVPNFYPPIKKEEGVLAGGYGMRTHPILKYKRPHNGIDYKAETEVSIHASAKGIVRTAEYKGSAGKIVVIDHKNGFSSAYLHMDSIIVQVGDKVSSSQVIGAVGNTGLSMAPHLHFEIRKDGKHVNPVDYLEPYQ